MQINNTMRYHFTPDRIALIKKIRSINIANGIGKKNPLQKSGGNVILCGHDGKHTGFSKIKKQNSFARYTFKGYQVSTLQDSHILPFIAAWFTVAKLWKQPECPLMDECITRLLISWNFKKLMQREVRRKVYLHTKSLKFTDFSFHNMYFPQLFEDHLLYIMEITHYGA